MRNLLSPAVMSRPPRFRRKRHATRRTKRGWQGVTVWLVLIALIAGWIALKDRLSPPEALKDVQLTFRLCGTRGSGPCVIDGDTVAIGQRRVRLTGYDAPEMDGACKLEIARANQAKLALHAWLAKGRFSWTGGKDPPRDRYGRELREARRGDELLAEHMIEAGLAEVDGWGEKREWC